MNEQPNLYEYCKQCHVWNKYPDLCFANYSPEKREALFGGSCPVAEEDWIVPDLEKIVRRQEEIDEVKK